MTQTATKPVDPVDLTFDIKCTPEHAFKTYTEHMTKWWPLETHSVDGKKAVSCHMDISVGGRITEQGAGGEEHHWGTVIECVPPNKLRHTWHPGSTPDKATEVDITFTGKDGRTQMRILHTGWEVLGDRASAVQEGYVSGWQFVAGACFVKLAED